jgi:hypothetical protein
VAESRNKSGLWTSRESAGLFLDLEDARDEALSGTAIASVFFSKGIAERCLFYVDSIEKRDRDRHEDNRQPDPRARIQGNTGEDDQQATVGWVADKTEDSVLFDALLALNDYVGRERPAELQDRHPANRQPDREKSDAEGACLSDIPEEIRWVNVTVPGADGDGRCNDRPEKKKGSSVVILGAGCSNASSRENQNPEFGRDPGGVQRSPHHSIFAQVLVRAAAGSSRPSQE